LAWRVAPTTKTHEELIENNDPYQATAIVTGYDMRSRPAGFAHCLREVLVKVSGEPRRSTIRGFSSWRHMRIPW
jgi:hypothetical protein